MIAVYHLFGIIAQVPGERIEAIEKLFWGVCGTLIGAAILGLWKWVAKMRSDQIRLTAKISQPGDLEIMQKIGCACMIVTIKSEGARVAKIKGAVVALEGVDLMPQFEKAFGASFNYVPSEVGPPPALVIDLVPLSTPEANGGFILERDDVIRFAMPIRVPILHLFPKAPSQNVWVAVQFFDETEKVIVRGLQVQNVIADLIEGWGKQAQTLNVDLTFNLRSSSRVMPGNPELMGKTNPNPLIFLPEETPEAVRKQFEARRKTISIGFPVYSLVAKEGSKAVMVHSPQGLLLPILTTKEIAEEYRTDSGMDLAIKELTTLQALKEFVENPPTDSEGKPPEYKIVLDTMFAGERAAGAIACNEFLATME